MFAIRKTAPARGLVGQNDVQLPTIGDTEVLIRVTHAGICGTDRHIYDWDEWSASRVTPPVTLGHEFVGVIAELGKDVADLSVGMRVSGEGHIGCRTCRLCRTGRSHICARVLVIGIDRDGAFSEYLALPRENVWPLGDHIPDRVAAVMDPFGNAMHTVMSADVSGRCVLVTGVGVIGLMAVAIARQNGASQIIVSDVEQHHLDVAGALGADHMLRADDPDWVDQATALSPSGQGVEAWLEMSGAPPAINGGLAAISNGGTAALLGLPRRPLEIDLAQHVILRGIRVLGISGRLKYETWYQMERFLARQENTDAVAQLITHEFAARDFEDAFALLATGAAIKTVLTF